MPAANCFISLCSLEWEWVYVEGGVGAGFSGKIMLQLKESCPGTNGFQRRSPMPGTCLACHSAEGNRFPSCDKAMLWVSFLTIARHMCDVLGRMSTCSICGLGACILRQKVTQKSENTPYITILPQRHQRLHLWVKILPDSPQGR